MAPANKSLPQVSHNGHMIPQVLLLRHSLFFYEVNESPERPGPSKLQYFLNDGIS